MMAGDLDLAPEHCSLDQSGRHNAPVSAGRTGWWVATAIVAAGAGALVGLTFDALMDGDFAWFDLGGPVLLALLLIGVRTGGRHRARSTSSRRNHIGDDRALSNG